MLLIVKLKNTNKMFKKFRKKPIDNIPDNQLVIPFIVDEILENHEAQEILTDLKSRL